MTPTHLDILVVIYFTWSLKVKFSSNVTPRNLTVETFVRIESRSLMSDAFFWFEIVIYEVLLTFRESLIISVMNIYFSFMLKNCVSPCFLNI